MIRQNEEEKAAAEKERCVMKQAAITLYMGVDEHDIVYHKLGEEAGPDSPEMEEITMEAAGKLLADALEQGEDGMRVELFNGLGTLAAMDKLSRLMKLAEKCANGRRYEICLDPCGITADDTLEDIMQQLHS